jgi:hypothetical protein
LHRRVDDVAHIKMIGADALKRIYRCLARLGFKRRVHKKGTMRRPT